MARHLRLSFPNASYHIMGRGNKKERIFRDRSDKKFFLNILRKTISRFHWICYSYCLMENHYHLFITTREANISQSMQFFNGGYTQYFHKKYDTVGHVFQGRFKSQLVDTEAYACELIRYIVLNPVTANLVNSPSQWYWSSHGEMLRGNKKSLIDASAALFFFGNSPNAARRAYIEFISPNNHLSSLFEMARLPEIIATEKYLSNLRAQINLSKPRQEISLIDQAPVLPSLEELFPKPVVKNKVQRNRQIARACNVFNFSLKDIAALVNLHYSTVSRIATKFREKN